MGSISSQVRISRSVSLDLLRAGAAFLVLISHVRSFVLVDYGNVADPSIVDRALYYASGFGHQAVVVFFVLSGFLVGGSVLSARSDTFWPRYALHRITRLWVVLVPALVATLVWNLVGKYTGGGEYLSGSLRQGLNSAPGGDYGLDGVTFFGNLLFLQTIVVSVFGDNGPLWSLANEFWYYVAFPLLYFGTRREYSAGLRLAMVGGGAAVFVLTPLGFLQGFVSWVFGVGVYWIRSSRRLVFPAKALFAVSSFVVCVSTFHLSRSGGVPDIALGAAFAVFLLWAAGFTGFPCWVSPGATWFSNFSYTLYLAHFPFAAFLWYTFLDGERVTPSAEGWFRFVAIVAACIGYSYLLYLAFERHTDAVRRVLQQRLVKISVPR